MVRDSPRNLSLFRSETVFWVFSRRILETQEVALMNKFTLTSLLLAGLAASSMAASIYIFSCGNAPTDNDTVAAFQAGGHDVTLGQGVSTFLNLNVIASFDAVYLPANHNYGFAWNASQEGAMLNYINAGGGLITAEWVVWMAATTSSYFPILRAAFPVQLNSTWDFRGIANYTRDQADPIMNAGLPTTFSMSTTSISGVHTNFLNLKSGAKSFYRDGTSIMVAGWDYGNGRVVNYSTVNGANQLTNSNFRILLGNTVTWVSSNPPTGPGIQGTIVLENMVGTYPGTASVRYVDVATGVGAGRTTALLSPAGILTADGPDVPGTYKVIVKASRWLSRVVTVTTSAGGTATFSPVSLLNGDCNGDNEIGPGDFSILASAFGTFEGDAGYQPRADLNGDGEVGPADFSVLAGNFGEFGDN